ncbi:GspE/PulE family protein [Roseiconus lacunae]|uniref:GspE/PulE family protein n=1 Tax=Roseiconus lacunae TaxID=2605694 RepID=UPI0011F31887|nr:GspE/PulE family protein [Roseiconus lacunae]
MSNHDKTIADPEEMVNAGSNAAPMGLIEYHELNMDEVRVDPKWALKIPASLAMRKQVIPLCKLQGEIIVACADIEDTACQRQLTRLLDDEVRLLTAEPESLRSAIKRVYGSVSTSSAKSSRGGETATVESDDAVAICEEVLEAAAMRGASDVHFKPNETAMMVRMRVDGKLESYSTIPRQLQGAVVSRLKVLSGLDIAEKRAPQDGRFTARLGPGQVKTDLRVATLPTRFGERVTLRLLGGLGRALSLTNIGMSDRDLEIFQRAITRPHGLVLLTGPTGSGKSTTLYAAIDEVLKRRDGNIITVEDPIEYEMEDVSQVEIDSVDKVSFAKALRSILRHDPDVVMIGEIRDLETAEIAVKASLTGHLVFSTLHTNTAAGVVTRLADMGLKPFLIAATLRLAVAQRLVRRLCPKCRTPRTISEDEASLLERPTIAGATIFDASGCVYCAGRGYNGRIALIECFDCDESVAKLITDGAGEEALLANARERKRSMLMDDAVEKLLAGMTTYQEVLEAVVVW